MMSTDNSCCLKYVLYNHQNFFGPDNTSLLEPPNRPCKLNRKDSAVHAAALNHGLWPVNTSEFHPSPGTNGDYPYVTYNKFVILLSRSIAGLFRFVCTQDDGWMIYDPPCHCVRNTKCLFLVWPRRFFRWRSPGRLCCERQISACESEPLLWGPPDMRILLRKLLFRAAFRPSCEPVRRPRA